MLVFLQFPITDIRSFLINTPVKMSSPYWPLPMPYKEFMRSAGRVRRRGKGGIPGWMGENEICDVGNAILFPDTQYEYWVNTLYRLIRINNLASYFYSDGLSLGKYELVFKYEPRDIKWESDMVSDSLRILGGNTVRINVRGYDNEVPLFSAGRCLAHHYLYASSYTKDYHQLNIDDWIFDELPVLFMEFKQHEQFQAPGNARYVSLNEQADIQLCNWWLQCANTNLPVWSLYYRQGGHDYDLNRSMQLGRSLRMRIMRLHAEYHVLRRVLKSIDASTIPLVEYSSEIDALQMYLNQATKRINSILKKTSQSDETEAIEVAMRLSLETVNPGQYDALLNKLDIIRPTIKRKIVEWTRKVEKQVNITVDGHGKLIFNGDLMIAEKIQNIHNDARQVENDQIKSLLEQLVIAVGEMSANFDAKEQETIAQDLHMLVSEVQKPNPSKRHWEFSIEGLKQAAQNVGEIGKPVIALAVQIANLLSLVAI